MSTSRRALIAGLAAAGLTACASGQEDPPTRRERWRELRKARREARTDPAPPAGAYGSGYQAAAKYSADRFGVSMLVMQAATGKILFEDYPAPDGGQDKGWELASGTKSFTGVMAGAASADGFLSIDEKAADTLSEWRDDAGLSRITIRHLLSLSSGLAIAGPAARPPPYAQAVRDARLAHEPGTVFEYGPEPFQVFGEILQRKLKAKELPADPSVWLQQRVFDRIGVRPSDWKRGADGNPFMPQGAHFTARNWAGFGKWVFEGAPSLDPAVYRALFASSPANPGYGLSWWMLRPGLKGPNPRAGVNAETIGSFAMQEDIVMAAGAGFQRLYLCRKRSLVVVRQANQIIAQMRAGTPFKDGEFLETLFG
ncbi:MAG: serine hydrolase [Hyphomonadaceae bacterium]